MFKRGKWIGAAVCAVTGTLMSGCLNESDPADVATADAAPVSGETWVEAWDASGFPGLPEVAELQSALHLSADQATVVEAARREWAREMEQRRTQPGHGVPGGFGDFEPPLLGFLGSVVPVLDADQIRAMATLLEQKREMALPRAGERPGRGPRERPGGPGQPGRPGGPGVGGPGLGGPIGGVLHELRDELDLDATQREALHDLLRQSHDTFHALRESFTNGQITAEQLRDAAGTARLALESGLADILSAGQFTLLMDTLAGHRSEMATRRLEHLEDGMQRRLDFLTAVLSPDETQVASVGAILTDSVAQRRTLLEALRDGTIEIEDALYQGYLIAQATGAAIRDLLTPEQQAIFDALKGLLPGNRGPHGP